MLSRLLSADYDNGTTVYNYGYDEAGNMVNMDGTTRTYNAANQMTNDGTNTLTYDNNGNLTNDGTNSYTWDRANRMLSVGNTSYKYDGAGNRIQQTVSSVVTDYLNDVQPALTKLLSEDDGMNVNRYVHGIRGIHAQEDNLGNWEYMVQDGLGSVRGLVDDAAVVQNSMSYDPYGNPMAVYGAGFGFTGEQVDANDLLYLRARYYDPALGVFSALDPFEGMQGRPMSINGYSWVEGNVPNAVDPTGLACQLTSYYSMLQFGMDTQLISLARTWNHIPQSDCARLTGGTVVNECGSPDITTCACDTGLTDEAFAYLMASILHQEGLVSGGDITTENFSENFGLSLSGGWQWFKSRSNDLFGGAEAYLGIVGEQFNSSQGIAKIRPDTMRDILYGQFPNPAGIYHPFDTSRLEQLREEYATHLASGGGYVFPFFNFGTQWEHAAIFSLDLTFLADNNVSLQLLAANLYRGILRIKTGNVPDISEVSMFNLAAWHNEGLQGGSHNNYNAKAAGYGSDVIRNMVDFVEGECDLGFGSRPVPWEDFLYYNDFDHQWLRDDWHGTHRQ